MRDLFEVLTPERAGQRGETPALCIGEPQPASTELGFEDAVCLKEIPDDLLLVPLEPLGDHGDQDVEDHSAPQVGGRDEIVRSSILPT